MSWRGSLVAGRLLPLRRLDVVVMWSAGDDVKGRDISTVSMSQRSKAQLSFRSLNGGAFHNIRMAYLIQS